MAIVDRERFPLLIIQIPEEEFPDKVKIIITGRTNLIGSDGRIAQLAAIAKEGSLGIPIAPTYFSKIYDESDFKKVVNSKKVAKLNTPYDEIVEVKGYAHRENLEDDTKIHVSVYTTTQNRQPSSTTTTHNLQGVFAYNFVMNKYNMDASYITQYVLDAMPAGQIASVAVSLATLIPKVLSSIVNFSVPSPKQIATKLLGPAAAAAQLAIATWAQQLAELKPKVTKAQAAINAAINIVNDPSSITQYMPVLMGWLIKYTGQNKIAETVYSFKG